MSVRLILALAVVAFGADNALQPDHRLTPGVTNPAVTQANIAITFCDAGWTKSIRPSAAYTTKLKVKQMAARGLKGKPSDYEEDHLVSLEVGGNPTDPRNLWPEPWPEARKKDVVETSLKRRICVGTLGLAAAQKILMTDWAREYFALTGVRP